MIKAIYASTKNSDMRYAVGIDVHDPFFYVDTGDKKYVFLDQREAGVFLESNKNDDLKLISVESLLNDIKSIGDDVSGVHKLGYVILKKYCTPSQCVKVPRDFPLGMADYIRSKGIDVMVEGEFFPERHRKNEDEIGHIKNSLSKTQLVFEKVEEILKNSKIKGNEIIFNNTVLTSEFLKGEAEKVLLENGLIDSEGMIISSGVHSAIPHHKGSGIIRPHQPIICDVFPRHRESNFFADITRTYVKGEPSDYFVEMYEAVLDAQEKALESVRVGVNASDVHGEVVNVFLRRGFDVGEKGFVHSTGHSLGLDVHDGLAIGGGSNHVLEEGNIFTIEPGLYYPEHGGVRIEDVVLVKEGGCENLTSHHKEFLIL